MLKQTLPIALLFICTFVLSPVCEDNEFAPVRPSDRPLVTGIDIDRLLIDFVPDNDAFNFRNSTTALFGGHSRYLKSKDFPNDRRFVKIGIEIYRSHRKAVEAAEWHLTRVMAAVAQLQPLDMGDPGFLLWRLSSSTSVYFIRDNVLVNFQVHSFIDSERFLRQLDARIKDGGPGVTRGDDFLPPFVLCPSIPDVLYIGDGEKKIYPVLAMDMNGLDVLCGARAVSMSSKQRRSLIDDSSPSVCILDGPLLQVEGRGYAKFKLWLYAVNERCVVSDDWLKEIRVIPLSW